MKHNGDLNLGVSTGSSGDFGTHATGSGWNGRQLAQESMGIAAADGNCRGMIECGSQPSPLTHG
jgi:hypothetical protein